MLCLLFSPLPFSLAPQLGRMLAGGNPGKATSSSCLCHPLNVSRVKPPSCFCLPQSGVANFSGGSRAAAVPYSTAHPDVMAELPLLPTLTPSPLRAPTPSYSLTPHGPVGEHHHGLVGPWTQLSHRGTPGSRTHKGPFLTPFRHGRSCQNTAALSASAGLTPAWLGVNCPAMACPPRCPPESASPFPNTGGLCGAVGLNGGSVRPGREGRQEPLASSVYLEMEIVARPGCRHFHARANGVGSAALHPSPSIPASDEDVGRDLAWLLQPQCAHTVLDPPDRCRWRAGAQGIGTDHQRGVGDAAGCPLPCGITALQSSTGSLRMCPHPGCVSPHCPWVFIPCAVFQDW